MLKKLENLIGKESVQDVVKVIILAAFFFVGHVVGTILGLLMFR